MDPLKYRWRLRFKPSDMGKKNILKKKDKKLKNTIHEKEITLEEFNDGGFEFENECTFNDFKLNIISNHDLEIKTKDSIKFRMTYSDLVLWKHEPYNIKATLIDESFINMVFPFLIYHILKY